MTARDPILETLTALGVPTARHEDVATAIRAGAWVTRPDRPAPPAQLGARIGDAPHDERYELRRLLGHGGSGAVYAALDRFTDEEVAVKLLRTGAARDVERMRREIGVLRMLRLPGVVGFRDEGTWHELPFVVMDLVRGAPFPGVGAPGWEPIADVSLGLVETLTRLHRAGIIHRDLKPANVLTTDGRATLLDFGLARPERATSDEIDGQLAGTPAYLAPEQFFGAEPSTRSDLYALGVMLYEALSGERPHDADTLGELVHKVLVEPPRPLDERAPEVPPEVARLVMRLLARNPDDRPASAVEVLRVLRDVAPPPHVRRLGSLAPVAEVLRALRAGRSVDVGGRPGSGRTRLLEDVAATLSDGGVPVACTEPALTPWRSLAPVVGDLGGDDPAALAPVAERRLRARLGAGLVLIVDDAHLLDAWSAELVDRLRKERPVLRVVDDGPVDVHLAPLTVAELEALFTGPKRVHHLPDDAASLVHRRVGGLPGPVLDRVGAWVRAGLATWHGDRVAIGRSSLDRLFAGLEVDPLVEDAPSADTERAVGPLVRMLRAGDLARIPSMARAIAAHELEQDRPGLAWAVLTEGLAVARRAVLVDELPALLHQATCVALSTNSERLLRAARVEIGRCDPRDALRLGRLCGLAARVLSGGGSECLAALEALPPFDDPEVELWRHRLAAFAGMDCTPEEHAAWLERVREPVSRLPGGAENVVAWEARVRYRRGDFVGAATLEERLFHSVRSAVRANAVGLNAAISWTEAGRFEDAARILDRLAETIPPRRVPVHEAMFEMRVRSLRYRRCEDLDPDPALRDALRRLDHPAITAPFLLLEAAIHWRRGELREARRLALASAEEFERYRRPWGAALAEALAVRAGDVADPMPHIVERARSSPYPEIQLQTFALLGEYATFSDPAPVGYPADARREVLSRREALDMLGAKEST